MKRIVAGLLLLALGVGGYWLYGWWFPSDEVVIRGMLGKLAASVSFKPAQGTISRMAGVGDVVALFTPDVTIALDDVPNEVREVQGTTQLRDVLIAARGSLRSVEISFSNVLVTLDAGGATANAQLVGRAQISGSDTAWYQELIFGFRKVDGDWRISRVETVKGLRM